MTKPYLVDKPIGATPLEALALVRAARPEAAAAKMSYAGRLDPMASGLILALHGDLLMQQEAYWHLPKVYDAAILLGVVTDSYDLLGMPTPIIAAQGMPDPDRILSVVERMVGKHQLAVPAYSSHRVDGQPLFALAREGHVEQGDIPVRPMAVSEIDVHDVGTMSIAALVQRVHERVPLVNGDFRQREIMAAWDEAMDGRLGDELPVIRLTVHCSAGTYIRSLAHALGRVLGTGGILIDLRRTRVGPWRVTDPMVVRPGQLEG